MTTVSLAHPTLYKKASSGFIQQWSIAVEGADIITTYGQVDGKMQVARETISQGKNVGRSNETTPEQQAEAEAKSRWEKKVKKSYVQSIEDAKAGEVDRSVITGGIDPMLAHVFAKQGHKIVYPAAVQPKLDGHRCIAIVADGKVTLWSRTRKPILGVPHVIAELERLGLPDGTVLDGELYNHDYRERFEELTSFIKRPKPKEGHEVVQYHVYDMMKTDDTPFALRQVVLMLNLGGVNLNIIVPVPTGGVNDEQELMEAFAAARSEGYEGLMVRNAMSPYETKRSYHLQKVKEFDDAEFLLVDIEEGRGRMAGKAVFICDNGQGETFKCKLVGNIDALAAYLDEKDKWIGKHVTVQFQGYTNTKMPRFPVALRFREDV